MKKSSLILIILSFLFVGYLIASDIRLKFQYNQIDKSDPFWNYTKIIKGSFHHLKINGGNVTRITFNPSAHGSVGILNDWERELKERIRTNISKDTLFVTIEPRTESPGRKDWMQTHVLMTISCPYLLSVEAVNTYLNVEKMNQPSMAVAASGHSRLEFESYIPDFDSIRVRQQDSTEVIFEMADEIKSSGVLIVKSLQADVQGHSLLDAGHFQIQSLQQTIGDTAGIILSGYTLKKLK
jgi:hypothetical protein